MNLKKNIRHFYTKITQIRNFANRRITLCLFNMGVDRYGLKGIGREKANLLTQDPTSLCVKVTKEQNITLSPAFIGSISEGISKQLDSKINDYEPELKGIVLAYEDLQLVSSDASLLADRPFLFLKIKVTYILFQPHIGSILTGVIKEIRESHLVCVVHEMFNATIFQSASNSWDISTLKMGDRLLFEVTEISKNTKIFFLQGKLANLPVDEASTVTGEAEDEHVEKETEDVMTDASEELM